MNGNIEVNEYTLSEMRYFCHLYIQLWTNFCSTLNKIKHAAVSDDFNQNGLEIYLLKKENYSRFRNSSSQENPVAYDVTQFYPYIFSTLFN